MIHLIFLKMIFNRAVLKVKVKVKSCMTLCDPMDCAHQAPPSMDSPGKSTTEGRPQ